MLLRQGTLSGSLLHVHNFTQVSACMHYKMCPMLYLLPVCVPSQAPHHPPCFKWHDNTGNTLQPA